MMGRPKTRATVVCKQCGECFEVRPSELKKGGGKFCSRSCATAYRNTHANPAKSEAVRKKISENHADVSGEKNPMYGRRGNRAPSFIDGRSSFSGETYRKILLASGTEQKCRLCGGVDGSIDVHHLDGNHKNNNPENLVFLCRKCHNTKAHIYERDNKGRITGSRLNNLTL
jgi:5-methylcytosine-specific restriction endonuclease McrA